MLKCLHPVTDIRHRKVGGIIKVLNAGRLYARYDIADLTSLQLKGKNQENEKYKNQQHGKKKGLFIFFS